MRFGRSFPVPRRIQPALIGSTPNLTGLITSTSTVAGTMFVPNPANTIARVGIVTGTVATASAVTITVSNARPVTLAKAT